MILRIEIPQELIRQDAEIVIKVSNRNNALGYVIENGSKHDAQQIAKEDMNGDPTLGEYVRNSPSDSTRMANTGLPIYICAPCAVS